MKYNKLVRDKIPKIIEERGEKALFHKADSQEYDAKLREKLQEEVDEFLSSNNKEELADILEVLYALGDQLGITRDEIEMLRSEKEKERGAFRERIILDES